MISRRFSVYLGGLLLLGSLSTEPAAAQQYAKPVYSETTKSYFQLIDKGDYSWEDANRAARRMVYKNVSGRLAVIPDRQVDELLRRTFQPRIAAWIGLRYFCEPRKSMWVTGNILDRRGYQNWARQWYGNPRITCFSQPGQFSFMPVYYTQQSRGFRWQATGPKKRFYGFFVEYVTGVP